MMNDEMITALEEKGFKRWTKGCYDRLYVNAGCLGLVCTYYKTGNISSATFCGDPINNCEARRMKMSKTYVNVADGKVVSDNSYLREKVEEILDVLEV